MDRDSSMEMLSYMEQPSTTMYDRESKKCVRNYNIKSLHRNNIQPFFSDSSQFKIGKLKELQRLNLDKVPDLPEASANRLDQNPSNLSLAAGKSPAKGKQLQKSPTKDATRSSVTLAQANEVGEQSVEDPILLKDKSKLTHMPNIQEIEEKRELDESLLKEMLPGQVKSNWALKHKYAIERALVDSLDSEEKPRNKRKTKGLFQVNVTTNAGNWMRDRDWKYAANDVYKSLEMQREMNETKNLEKKKHQKRVQYMALENQYKLHVKRK